jgi:hypothetical protein
MAGGRAGIIGGACDGPAAREGEAAADWTIEEDVGEAVLLESEVDEGEEEAEDAAVEATD